MPYQKKIWCPHPSHINLTRSGSKPSHPEGRKIINALEAEAFNKQIASDSELTSALLKDGDKLCQRCFNSLPNLLEAYFDTKVTYVKSPDPENFYLPSFDEQLQKNLAREELNAVFQVLKMERIRDE
jgi:hypothetical protein